MVNITETKKVWGVRNNTDRTEGKGASFIEYFCEILSTAKKLGKKQYVQGSDCPIEEKTLYMIDGRWYGEVMVINPTIQDINDQKEYDQLMDLLNKIEKNGVDRDKVLAIVKKIRDAGVSTKELSILFNFKE